VWLAIVVIFVALMASFYRRNTRSNFRRSKDGLPPPKVYFHAKRLGTKTDGKVVVKDAGPTEKKSGS